MEKNALAMYQDYNASVVSEFAQLLSELASNVLELTKLIPEDKFMDCIKNRVGGATLFVNTDKEHKKITFSTFGVVLGTYDYDETITAKIDEFFKRTYPGPVHMLHEFELDLFVSIIQMKLEHHLSEDKDGLLTGNLVSAVAKLRGVERSSKLYHHGFDNKNIFDFFIPLPKYTPSVD